MELLNSSPTVRITNGYKADLVGGKDHLAPTAPDPQPAPATTIRLPLLSKGDTTEAAKAFSWPTTDDKGYTIREEPYGSKRKVRILIMGAGAAGINFLKIGHDKLEDVEMVCYEKNAEIGGTWLENTYPGVACDIPSVCYQFTWEPALWTQYYSTGGEIQHYLLSIVKKYNLRRFIHLRHSILSADWDEVAGKWSIRIRDEGTQRVFTEKCDFFLNAGGILNNWKYPDIEGLSDFQGKLMHTASWDNSVDLKGKRVAVIGSGSSGAQIIPKLQTQVEQLYTWIRSPTWITPGFAQRYAGKDGGNFNYTREQHDKLRQDPEFCLRYRKAIEAEITERFRFIFKNSTEAQAAREYAVKEMTRKLNGDERIAKKIIPQNFPVGCRRPTPGEGFLEALVQPNVSVLDGVPTKITEKGIISSDGQEVEVDALICATGFVTDWVPRIPIRAGGRDLREIWGKTGAVSYLAVGVPEFPNLFSFAGPYGPLAVGSLLPVIEVFTEYIIQAITKVQLERIKSIRPRLGPSRAFKQHVDLYMGRTAWSAPCSSWFKQGKTEGRLTMYPGSRVHFFKLLEMPRYEDYDIDYLDNNMWSFLGNGFHLCETNGDDVTWYMGKLDMDQSATADITL